MLPATNRYLSMVLWFAWMQAVRSLRPACRRSRTFLWMVLALAGLCCRSDRAGVTSYIRVLGFGPEAYHRFLHLLSSRPEELHLQPLTEPCLTVSHHTALHGDRVAFSRNNPFLVRSYSSSWFPSWPRSP